MANDNGTINIKHLHMFLEKLSQVNKQKMNEIRSKTLSNDEFKEEIEKYQKFERIVVQKASATISTNCGLGTMGVLYIKKGKDE